MAEREARFGVLGHVRERLPDLPAGEVTKDGSEAISAVRRREKQSAGEWDAIVVPGEADVEGAVPDDEMVLAWAVDAGADVIVSGDGHLLELGQYQDIPILTVRDFLERTTADQVS